MSKINWTHFTDQDIVKHITFIILRSAFFWFSNDERAKVKGQNPEYGVGDIAKELGRRWAEADAETKGKYEALADKDKARYEKVSMELLRIFWCTWL